MIPDSGNSGLDLQRTSLKVVKRMRPIEELPPAQQKLILRSLDMMIDSAQRSDD
jgi:hypothetical protein